MGQPTRESTTKQTQSSSKPTNRLARRDAWLQHVLADRWCSSDQRNRRPQPISPRHGCADETRRMARVEIL